MTRIKRLGGGSSQSGNKKLNARKCKTLRTECASNREMIVVDGEEVDDVEEFTSLGAILDTEGRGSIDIMHRSQKARGAFHRLRRIWTATGIGRKTKIRLFKTSSAGPTIWLRNLKDHQERLMAK